MSALSKHNRQESATCLSERRLHEYSFTDADFQYVRKLIYKVAGISLAPSKKDLVYSRLSRRLRIRRIESFRAYIDILETGDTLEMEAFTNALTTNMTSFFREAHHFQILDDYLSALPKSSPIHIWTCASSTGEEPYSIAMTVADHYQSFETPVRILATDIDTNVLEKAKLGQYRLEQLNMFDSMKKKRFFQKGCGKNTGLARVRPELQKMITFRRLNLLDETWGVKDKFAAVFCRNVMIYFDRTTQYRILQKMKSCLQPQGLFFAGHSENFHHASDLFKVKGKTVYVPKI